MGMYEIPRNVKGERKNINNFFYEIINMDNGICCNRFNFLFNTKNN